MRKSLFALLFLAVFLAAPSAMAFGVHANAQSVENANLNGTSSSAKISKPAKKAVKKSKKSKSKSAKSTSKSPAAKKTAVKKPTRKTIKKASAKSALSTNAEDVEKTDLGSTDDGQSDGGVSDGNALKDGINQDVIKGDSQDQSLADTIQTPDANLPKAAASSARNKGLAIAGISGVSGLGLLMLLKHFFFH